MPQHERSIWDDISDTIDEIIKRLREALDPQKRQPARVPVPIRPQRPRPDPDSH